MIGIVTQALGYNYGGILQNYALQQALKKLGYESITIDVFYRYPYFRYLVSCLLTLASRMVGKKRNFPPKPYCGRRIPKITGEFMVKHLCLTEPYDEYDKADLKKYGIDTLIVGSDQVWRVGYNPCIENMFLAFSEQKVKKIAYAASFGTGEWEYNERQTQNCRQLIQSFSGVSVREKSGINLCQEHLHRPDAQLVLDPTLLLSKEDYCLLCKNIPVENDPYLCAYILDITEEKQTLINRMAQSRGLKVRFFSSHDDTSLKVEEWLATFRDASFVVTDSYHGTVFSILFQKDFLIIPNSGRGIDRFDTLLSILNLQDRIIRDGFVGYQTIDWNSVSERIKIQQETSMLFLKQRLEQ